MEIFSALLALYMGISRVTGEFPLQRPVTPSFDVFFDLCLNKRRSKQSWSWWFETPSCSLLHHCNGMDNAIIKNPTTKIWNHMGFNSLIKYKSVLINVKVAMSLSTSVYRSGNANTLIHDYQVIHVLNSLRAKCFRGSKTYICSLCHSSTLTWHSQLNSFLK